MHILSLRTGVYWGHCGPIADREVVSRAEFISYLNLDGR